MLSTATSVAVTFSLDYNDEQRHIHIRAHRGSPGRPASDNDLRRPARELSYLDVIHKYIHMKIGMNYLERNRFGPSYY